MPLCGGLLLHGVVMNAAGARCTTFEELENLNSEPRNSAVVTKSMTVSSREGNEIPRWARLPYGGIQSMGLPNLGFQKYVDFIKEFKSRANKPIIASVSGLSLQDNVAIISRLLETPKSAGVDGIELNLSCPNIVGKPVVGYDFQQMNDVLSTISKLPVNRPFGLKLPPYLDKCLVEMAAEIIEKYEVVTFITLINSVGNSMYIDWCTETSAIRPNDGHGGLCGPYIKPIGLGNVHAFRRCLGDKMGIIGVGGIETASDIYEYFLAGANAVQIATKLEIEGTAVLTQLQTDFDEILESKGISDPTDIYKRLRLPEKGVSVEQ